MTKQHLVHSEVDSILEFLQLAQLCMKEAKNKTRIYFHFPLWVTRPFRSHLCSNFLCLHKFGQFRLSRFSKVILLLSLSKNNHPHYRYVILFLASHGLIVEYIIFEVCFQRIDLSKGVGSLAFVCCVAQNSGRVKLWRNDDYKVLARKTLANLQ